MRDGFDSNIRYGTYFVHVDISQTDHSLFLGKEKTLTLFHHCSVCYRGYEIRSFRSLL